MGEQKGVVVLQEGMGGREGGGRLLAVQVLGGKPGKDLLIGAQKAVLQQWRHRDSQPLL